MAEGTQPVAESNLAEEQKREAEDQEYRKQLPWLFRQKWLLPILFFGAVLTMFGEKLLRVGERIAGGIAATFQWGVLLLDGLWNWVAARLTLFDVAVLVGLGLILGSLARIRWQLQCLIEEVQELNPALQARLRARNRGTDVLPDE